MTAIDYDRNQIVIGVFYCIYLFFNVPVLSKIELQFDRKKISELLKLKDEKNGAQVIARCNSSLFKTCLTALPSETSTFDILLYLSKLLHRFCRMSTVTFLSFHAGFIDLSKKTMQHARLLLANLPFEVDGDRMKTE